MKQISSVVLILFISVFCTGTVLCKAARVSIVFENKENLVLTTAANELQKYLSEAFPKTDFYITNSQEDTLSIFLKIDTKLDSEEYLVTNQKNQAILSGGSAKGVLNGVYGILGKLGFDFYLSFEKKPKPGIFSFAEWQLTDKPLKGNRIVFNWHNFISGCSGWDLDNWKNWIEQSAKMGFNSIMVHAYGNNPMYSFSYNGQDKQVGYLSSTWSGRDWGTEHVNDIRNLTEENLFKKPVFGCRESLVSDSERITASTSLMQSVFRHAHKYGMKIIYAVDVDTWMSNPQNIISTLPEEAKFRVGNYQLVNPDTKEGYKYYLALFKTIINTYPEVTNIAVWARTGKTLWKALKYEDLPKEWKDEYDAKTSGNEKIRNDPQSTSSFAVSKIAKAFIKANRETGSKLKLSFGSWDLAYINSSNFFFDKAIAFLPLDWALKFDHPEIQEILASVGKDRELNPIIWAHHDDHKYIGRPLYPYKDLNTKLDQTNSKGFGIIHWTTRPLDLYFKNSVAQVWKNTLNEAPEKAINKMAKSIFETNAKEFGKYLNLWHSEGPVFGRETSDHFIDIGKPELGINNDETYSAIKKAKERLLLLTSVNTAKLPENGKKWLNYFKKNEEFYISFFENHVHFNKALQLAQNHQYTDCRAEIELTTPGKSIDLYQKAISQLNPTTGEKAIVISLALRWLPDYIDIKQQVGISPVLINYAQTSHDSLAQYAGLYTFFADNQKQLWVTLGNKELGIGNAGQTENWLKGVNESWLTFEDKNEIPVRTMRNHQLKPGKYSVEVIYPKNENGATINFVQNGNLSGKIRKDELKSFITIGEGDLKMVLDTDNKKVKISGLIIKPE
jgi:hypothetical protein